MAIVGHEEDKAISQANITGGTAKGQDYLWVL